MSGEQWRPVPGYEDLYEVSDHGQVRGLDRVVHRADGRRRTIRGQVIRPRMSNGYPTVSLSRGNRKIHRHVHRLVALAFIGPCPAGLEVRHLNGDPLDLTLSNLAYGTHGENTRDKRAHGTDHNVIKTQCPQGHPYDDANTYVLPSRPTARYCRACAYERNRARREASQSAGKPGRAA